MLIQLDFFFVIQLMTNIIVDMNNQDKDGMKNLNSQKDVLMRIEQGLELIAKTVPDAENVLLRDEQRVRFWLQEVLNNDPDRLEWHIKRLQGIGGSDIGPLVKELIDGGSTVFPDSGAYFIVGRMLCKTPPKKPTWDQMVGSSVEGAAKKMLISTIESLGGKLDEQAMQAMNRWNLDAEYRKSVCPELADLVGEPDLVVLVPDPTSGKTHRLILDVKLDKTGKDKVVIDEYVYQLHHYGLILDRALKMPVNGLRICKFGPEENRPAIKHHIVPIQPERFNKILMAAARTMEYRANGVQPPMPLKKSPRYEDPEEIKGLTDIANDHFAWAEIERVAADKKEEARARLEFEANKVSLNFDVANQKLGSQGTLKLGNTSLGFGLELDTQLAVEALISEGVIQSEEEVLRSTGSIDESMFYNLVSDLAQQRGVTEEEFLAPFRTKEIDEHLVWEKAKEHFKDSPVPGLTTKLRVSASRSKNSTVEDCRAVASMGVGALHKSVFDEASKFTESGVSDPAKPKAKPKEANKATTVAKKDKSSISF